MSPKESRKWTWRPIQALLAALVLGGILGGGAQADVRLLSLWEKARRGTLVARVTVLDGDNRYALMRVDEVIKGEYAGETLRVVFRARNLNRQNWEERIIFVQDDSLILFLEPYTKDGEPGAADQFALVRGFQGKESVPLEGTDAYLSAIREFSDIQSITSQLQIWEAARNLLHADNPHLVEAGFQQILKFRLVNADMVPVLLAHLESPHVAFRSHAARTLGQMFEIQRQEDLVLETEDHVRDLLLHAARNDPDEGVRVEAIRALEAKSDKQLVPSFQDISANDPSQAVRYEAEKAVLRLKQMAVTPPNGSD